MSQTDSAVVTSVEVFADITCPFTHVGLRRFTAERDARGSSLRIRVRAWPLEWINGHQVAPDLAVAEIGALREVVAPELFSGLDLAHWPSTTIAALGLAAAAYRRGPELGERISLRLREALFEEGRDIGDEAELRAIAGAHDIALPDTHAAEADVRADWEDGRARNVQGSPHFFAGPREWFCPSLRIRHEGADFDITVDTKSLNDFYAVLFGSLHEGNPR